jgi:DNA-binding beta-propeller fold protein YncE
LCYSYLNSYPFGLKCSDGQEFVNYESPHVHPIDASPDGKWLAVCNTADGHVEIMSLSGGKPELVTFIRVGLDPVSVRFRTSDELWVVNHVSDTVNVVDMNVAAVVYTLAVGDEPADVVFAGDPLRAYVTCSTENKVLVYDPKNLEAEPETIAIEGEDPRALAVSPDGSTVYVAIFESGNSTPVLAGGIENAEMMSYPPNVVSSPDSPYEGENPPPQRLETGIVPLKSTVRSAPKASLIVKKDTDGIWRNDNGADWSDFVSGDKAGQSGRSPGWDVVDNDIAAINTETGNVTYTKHLMNIAMAMDVNPTTGELFLAGTDAINEVRYEPALKSKFVKVMGAVAGGEDRPAVFDLNPISTTRSILYPFKSGRPRSAILAEQCGAPTGSTFSSLGWARTMLLFSIKPASGCGPPTKSVKAPRAWCSAMTIIDSTS